MVKQTQRKIAGFVAAGLAGALLLGLPAPARADTSPPSLLLAQANPAPAPPAPAAKRLSRAERVEARIKSLHDQLKITDAQTPQWDAVAQVMRDNAVAERALHQQRAKSRATGNAVDNLRSYQQLIELHDQGLQKLIPVFQTLYETMSPEQKQLADAAFGHRRSRGAKK